MLNSQQLQVLEQPTRFLLIIFGFLLIAPVILFLVFFVLRQPPKFTMAFEAINIIGIVFAAMELVPSIVIPLAGRRAAITEITKSMAGKLDQPEAATKAIGALSTSAIIQMALYEGALIFNLICWFSTGSVYSLMVAGVCFGLLLMVAPLPGRMTDAVEAMLKSAA